VQLEQAIEMILSSACYPTHRAQPCGPEAADADCAVDVFALELATPREMPCMPALLRTADSVRRSTFDISGTGVPLAASSRKRPSSSRDHVFAGLLRKRRRDGNDR
jgi:hypothetical protein